MKVDNDSFYPRLACLGMISALYYYITDIADLTSYYDIINCILLTLANGYQGPVKVQIHIIEIVTNAKYVS